MRNVILLVVFQFFLLVAFGQNFKVGDKVEVYNSGGWYKGNIEQIGSGDLDGYYYVHYDGYSSSNQWMKASNIKLQKASATIISTGPRNGTYIILSYGNPYNPIRIGYFELNNGQYSYYDMAKKFLGKGSYAF